MIRLRVKELREGKGWTQAELSRRSGIRQPTISDIEAEKSERFLRVLERLAVALNVEPGDLIERVRGRK